MPRDEKSGLSRRIYDAARRRMPHFYSYVIYSGTPDGCEAGALERMGFRMVDITPENVAEAGEFRPVEVLDTLRKYLALGTRGWYAVGPHGIAGHAFLAMPEDEPQVYRRVKLYPGEAAIILVFTRPEYRGTGIATGLVKEILAVAQRAGVRTIVTWTIPANKASQKVQQKGGLKYQGRLLCMEVLCRQAFRINIGSPVQR